MKTPNRIIPLALSTLSIMLAASAFAARPQVGDKAPTFQGTDQNGQPWKLNQFVGKEVILLYFYPKDETPGCTKEACGLRDRMADLQQNNVKVVGVSFDSAKSHQAFIANHQLNFTLLADTDGKIADLYGTRRAPGRKGDRRVSFLIGLNGKIMHITDNPSADVQLSDMQAAIAALKKH